MAPPLRDLAEEVGHRADELVALRRDFHRHPELGFGERRTAEMVAERLDRAGLEVRTGVAGTGVVGVLRGDRPGRTIAWRADMDALPLEEVVELPFRSSAPGVMHACGHDGHTAIGIVVAEILAAARASLPGTAVFLFQPAEEILGGARPMLEAGVLDSPRADEVYGLHLTSLAPVGLIEVRPGITMASADFFEIEVLGRGGHGAMPHLAIDPIAIAAQILVGLPQLVSGAVAAQDVAVLSVGQFAAGTAPNIIPRSAVMRGSLRALRAADREKLLDRMATYLSAVARAHGGEARLRAIGSTCPALVNHEAPSAHVERCAGRELGEASVTAGGPILASDDMSLFLAERPGCFFRVGAAPEGRPPPAHHSPDFEIHEGSLAIGARAAAAVLVGALAPTPSP
jgi:amidohydrolase